MNQLLDKSQQRQAKEQLLIKEDDNGLNLSLYLDQSIVDNLEQHNPLQHLNENNLQDCCLALEGVSHFLYVIWRAEHDFPVTQFELELQAEVDKYIALLILLSKQSEVRYSRLNSRLFERIRYADDLSNEQMQRYYLANRLAAYYCEQLQHAYVDPGKVATMLRQVRRFYRLGQARKLRLINLSSSHQKTQHYLSLV